MKSNTALFIIAIIFSLLTLRGVFGNPTNASFKNDLDAPAKPFELSPERNRFILTYSLVEYGSFALPTELVDSTIPDVGYYNHHFYVYFAPGVSLMVVPFYLIGRIFHLSQLVTFSFISIISMLNLFIIYKVSTRIFNMQRSYGYIAVIIFGYGCTAWSYANTLYQHHLTTFFLLSSFYAVWLYKHQLSNGYKILLSSYIWTCYGLAIFIDYPNTILMLPTLMYFLYAIISSGKKTASMITTAIGSICFVSITGIHLWYNSVNFGSPFKVSGSIISYKTVKENFLLLTPDSDRRIKEFEKKKNPSIFFQVMNVPNGIYTLLFSLDRGLFFFSPIFILGVAGMRKALRQKEGLFLCGFCIMNLLFYSSFNDYSGGWAFGPRYLIPSMAVLSVFSALWISVIPTARKFTTILLLFMYSSAIALAGTLTSNAVPPLDQARTIHSFYNFFLNFQYIFENKSSSFFYTIFLSRFIPVFVYYLVIYIPVNAIFLLTLYHIKLMQRETTK